MDELHLIPCCIVEFYAGVTRCPNGAAQNCTDLNNRGHSDWPEITVWPRQHAHPLTTGREFNDLQVTMERTELNSNEKKICAILGLKEWELAVFLRRWTPLYENEEYPTTAQEVAKKMYSVSPQKKVQKCRYSNRSNRA